MATLKGQNFRILVYDSTASKYKVVGMATSCTITHTNNNEEAAHKDIVGMAALPEVVSQGWGVQVESLNVADVGAMLTAIKNLTPFKLMWTETDTSDNQTAVGTDVARTGDAWLNDSVFTFDNRTNATKSLQFTGNGALEELDTIPTVQTIAVGSLTKGQFVRLFLSSNNSTVPSSVIAAARQLSLHVSLSLEDSTTKDTTGTWVTQEPTAINYDITSNALVRSNDVIASSVDGKTLSSMQDIKESGTPVKWQIANVSGDNQRTKSTIIASGSVIISQLQITSAVNQAVTYQTTLTGYGPYTVGA